MDSATTLYTQQDISVVAFRLNQRTFALPLDVIVQIVPMMTITPIPHMSGIVRGAINIRGEDVLVINLRAHFSMAEVEPQLYTPLLLLRIKDLSLALIVDAVLDVMNLPVKGLTGLQHMLPEGIENIPLVQGVAYYKDDTILLLDPDNLFYNHHNLGQYPAKPIPGEIFDVPVDAAMEDALVSQPVKISMAKKKPTVKKTRAIKKATKPESASVAEDTSISTGEPGAEDIPAA